MLKAKGVDKPRRWGEKKAAKKLSAVRGPGGRQKATTSGKSPSASQSTRRGPGQINDKAEEKKRKRCQTEGKREIQTKQVEENWEIQQK